MELMNCRSCKKLFNYITGEKLCPACKKALEDKFEEVKYYIEDNPGKSVQQVAEACEISVQQIKAWVRQERLSFSSDSLVGLECERCGRMVHSGRFCSKCAGNLVESMNASYKDDKAYRRKVSSIAKMRFLDQ